MARETTVCLKLMVDPDLFISVDEQDGTFHTKIPFCAQTKKLLGRKDMVYFRAKIEDDNSFQILGPA